jgi:hypothetical protein
VVTIAETNAEFTPPVSGQAIGDILVTFAIVDVGFGQS